MKYKVNVPFCTVALDRPLLLDQMCTNANLKLSNAKGIGNILGNDRIQVSEFIRISIFTKLQHEVFGMGIECSKYKTKWIFRKTIFGA